MVCTVGSLMRISITIDGQNPILYVALLMFSSNGTTQYDPRFSTSQ